MTVKVTANLKYIVLYAIPTDETEAIVSTVYCKCPKEAVVEKGTKSIPPFHTAKVSAVMSCDPLASNIIPDDVIEESAHKYHPNAGTVVDIDYGPHALATKNVDKKLAP